MKKVVELYNTHKAFVAEVVRFGMVGVLNTLLGWVIMAVLYNLIHLNYWLSTGISYFIGGVFSYHVNARFTFQVENRDKGLPWRFAVNIIVCYLIAYGTAQPLIRYALSAQPAVIVDNIAMLAGMCFFVVLNFCGQKLLVFRTTGRKTEDRGREER